MAHLTYTPQQDLAVHEAAYHGFIRGAGVAAYHIFFTLVALVDFRFVNFPLNLFIGFGGLFVATAIAALTWRTGKFIVPIGILILYVILVGMNVHA
jgi:hypothetical protein